MEINKNKIGNFLIIGAFFILSVFLGSYLQKTTTTPEKIIEYVKTIDTLYLERKVIEEKIVEKVKYRDKLIEQEKTIVYNEEECKEIVDNLKDQLANCDSIVVFKDNIITKTDSIVIYKDKIIDKMVVPKKKIVTFGPQVGYNPFTNKVTIGAGATINVVSF